jgi:hypothetical protein
VPYLRIIMCLTRDDVKCLFLTRANTMSRAELDAARNSDTSVYAPGPVSLIKDVRVLN